MEHYHLRSLSRAVLAVVASGFALRASAAGEGQRSALIDARVRFIARRQQRDSRGDPLDGAYLAYDNEAERQVYSTVNDHNAGRERMAMGVLGALYLPQCRDEAFRVDLAASLRRYAAFVARELEDDPAPSTGPSGGGSPGASTTTRGRHTCTWRCIGQRTTRTTSTAWCASCGATMRAAGRATTPSAFR